MHHIARFILVDAPVATVFAFLADYRNIPRFQPQFETATLISPQAQGVGATIELRGSFRGLPITAQTRIITFDPPHLMISDSTGQVRSRTTWRCTPAPGTATIPERTRASIALDYEVNLPGLGWLLDGLVTREVSEMTVQSLQRLKHLVETSAQP